MVTKIVPTKPDKEGGFAVGRGTRVFSDGREVHGVIGLSIDIRHDDVIKATADLFCSLEDTLAETSFVVRHPRTGERIEITGFLDANGLPIHLCKS